MTTRDTIIRKTVRLLARYGYEGASMRAVSLAAGVQPSVIYYHFKDKQALLREVREHINGTLRDGIVRLQAGSAAELLRQQLYFQIQQRELIVAVLKYFMSVPADFPAEAGNYVPRRAYAHVQAVIDRGIAERRYHSTDAAADAKTISHLINGFLIEYYPRQLSAAQTDNLVNTMADFIERGLAPTTVPATSEAA